ncbi:response regulator [Bacillus sp. FJAT-27916]|uniref:response regulator n=1 Tax=Bacillus sp. FJAT-27916 TaxID=1679169 RepID=UPI0009E4DAF6|nr:response regulator [Bacillus sp. FJAT-27916]
MKAIRANKAFETTPILVLTAKAFKGDQEKCLECGVSDLRTKPINLEQLFSTIKKWLV